MTHDYSTPLEPSRGVIDDDHPDHDALIEQDTESDVVLHFPGFPPVQGVGPEIVAIESPTCAACGGPMHRSTWGCTWPRPADTTAVQNDGTES